VDPASIRPLRRRAGQRLGHGLRRHTPRRRCGCESGGCAGCRARDSAAGRARSRC
jgi:hypothetical protein